MHSKSELLFGEGSSEWGKMISIDSKDPREQSFIKHSVEDIKTGKPRMLIRLVGNCNGLFVCHAPLNEGTICPRCIRDDKRLVHVWSH